MTVVLAAGGTKQVVPLLQQNGIEEGHEKRFRPAAHVVSRGVRAIAEAMLKKTRVKEMWKRTRSDMVVGQGNFRREKGKKRKEDARESIKSGSKICTGRESTRVREWKTTL